MKKRMIAVTMTVTMALFGLAGCGQNTSAEIASGGVLLLSVNPEIAVAYNEEGIVTDVTARNEDAKEIIKNSKELIGQKTRDVVTALVTVIGEAGYFVEEVEGEYRQITIEIEKGSKLPHNRFLDEVVTDVRACVNANKWHVPMEVETGSEYGITAYDDTDYGPNNDGVTDYDDTDYGPGNDGATDYDDTDYGPNNDGVTDYDDTDYGPDNDGVTDYDDTDYGPGNDGVTDYNDSNYGNSPYDDTDYGDSAYDDGDSDYSNSDYDDDHSDYGSSEYHD